MMICYAQSMRSYKVEGVVIRKRNFGEKDRILTIFSRERGKLEILSKGCRRPGSRLSHCSDLGVGGIFFVHKGKNLDILGEFKSKFFPQSISGDYDKTKFISIVFAILDKLFETDHPHRKSYQSIIETIENIGNVPVEILRIVFLSRIISDLGIQPQLSTCTFCGLELSAAEDTVYDEQGEFYHARCLKRGSAILPNTIKYLKLIFTKNLAYICKVKVTPEVSKQAKEYLLKNYIWHFGTNNVNRVLFDIDNHE